MEIVNLSLSQVLDYFKGTGWPWPFLDHMNLLKEKSYV